MQIRDYPTKYGDIKYYRKLHVKKMQAQWDDYVSYDTFCGRLRKMVLYDAIHTPRVHGITNRNVKWKYSSKTPIQDWVRRTQVLKEQNIPVLDLEQIDKILFPKQKQMAKYNMKPKKKTIRARFISLFKR